MSVIEPTRSFYTERAIDLLSEGFKHDLATYISQDDRFTELVMELTEEFTSKNMCIVSEDIKADVMMQMFETLRLVAQ